MAYGENPFIQIDEVKEYLNIANTTVEYDSRINSIIGMSCAAVEHYIGREVLSNTYTEMFAGSSVIHTKRAPIQQVFELKTENYVLNNPAESGEYVIPEDPVVFTNTSNAGVSENHRKFGKSSLKLNTNTDNISATTDTGKLELSDTNFTIEMWVNPSEAIQTAKVFEVKQDEDNSLALTISSSKIEATGVVGGNSIEAVSYTISSLPVRTWSHIALTRDYETGNAYIHVNGEYKTATPLLDSFDFEGTTTIGNFKGYVDEVRVSKQSRYKAETFTVAENKFNTDDKTALLLHFDTTDLSDTSRARSEFTYKKEVGAINILIPSGDIVVTYKAGYDIVPADIKVATLEYIRLIYGKSLAEQSKSIGNQKTQQFGNSRAVFPKQVAAILDLYRRIL